MALISFRPSTPTNAAAATTTTTTTNKKEKHKDNSWEHFKNLLSCKNTTASPSSQVHDPSSSSSSKYVRLSSTCGSSICSFREVAHGNTRVVDHASNVSSDVGGGSSSGRGRHKSSRKAAAAAAAAGEKESTPLTRSCGGGMQLRKLSGCYECRAVNAEPASRRYPRPRTLCPCTDCREVFTKPESLEHHQALRHAVSELGPEDSGRNIVEIIFKSSWQKKDSPICKIERILKVHTTQRTAARFEDYRDSVRSSTRALLPRRNPRCAADGNELLRFHCTSLSCPLGANSSTSLCLSPSSSSSSSNNPQSCDVCTIIRYGFSRAPASAAGPHGIRTTASSGRAHDCGPKDDHGGGGARIRAMLVCRVIAGRVKRAGVDKEEEEEGQGQFDSVAGEEGVVGSYGNLEELFVANPRAILPCFVVIYRALD
ncbi:uncharacterized protein M6B38_183490 [Iris pallida]|uniref:C2H2-type domain-containing protein n=1 Tax=Iris pallida TaxID=29817 RepID=A0AAX6EKM2_IRIPA|nr:uncharacterized protein M6B38_183490 [Iris pallida]